MENKPKKTWHATVPGFPWSLCRRLCCSPQRDLWNRPCPTAGMRKAIDLTTSTIFKFCSLCLLQCTVMCSTHSCAALTILLNQIKGKRADTNPKNTPSEPTGEVIFAPGGFSVALHITTTGLLLQANGDGSKPTIGVWATILMLRGLWCDPWFCIGSELVLTFWGLTTLGWCYFFWIRVLRSERVL